MGKVLTGGLAATTSAISTYPSGNSLSFDFSTNRSEVFKSRYIENSETGFREVDDITKINIDLMAPLTQSYVMDYEDVNGSMSASDLSDNLKKSVNLLNGTPQQLTLKNLEYYNRFKLKSPDEVLQKAFGHVFFVRPNLNIFANNNITTSTLNDELKYNQQFMYSFKNNPDLVRSLVKSSGQSHDFNLFLSNKAISFGTSDEYITTDTYGQTYTGHKISYGKHNVDSKTAGDFSISYRDDRDCNVYNLHRIWTEYISMAYRGTISPALSTILNKELDYATSVYYFVTAEDGESIIFWTKYYGVFPSTIPSQQFSWNGDIIKGNMEYDVKYQFSYKDDYNPFILTEFNANAGITGSSIVSYVPVYDQNLATVGNTWVGTPYIELCDDALENPNSIYKFKLKYTSKT